MSLFGPLPEIRAGLRDPVWGIDPSTHRFCLSVILPPDFVPEREIADHVGDGWRIISRPMPKVEGSPARRLSEAHEVIYGLFMDARDAYGLPIYAVIEQPFGTNVHPQSYYFVGVGLLACAQVLGIGGVIGDMGPGTWKRLSMGQGNGAAKKPKILRWAREEIGYLGECPKCGTGRMPDGGEIEKCKHACVEHDEADSLGIAIGAARHWVNEGTLVV
jgi:hypothetical protein